MAQIRVTLTRSLIGRPADQRATVRALGLGRMNSSAVHDDTPSLRGMVRKVRHLVTVEAAPVEAASAVAATESGPAPEPEADRQEESE
jgi:large subunit ribosomal protein L30